MEPVQNTLSAASLAQQWKQAVDIWVCETCDWTYLMHSREAAPLCPYCFQSRLKAVAITDEFSVMTRPPEMALAHSFGEAGLESALQQFARGIPFAPADLSWPNLKQRLQKGYLPMWLVDCDVSATWRAEAGYNYQVVSHQDHYDQNSNRWMTREVKETRIRWEPRLGRLGRNFQNVAAPAIQEMNSLRRALGEYDLSAGLPFSGMAQNWVRLPNRLPDDAWTDAQAALQSLAGEQCRQASGADHIRGYTWKADFASQHWTLLLLPIYSTYYQDDEGKPCPVFIQGQTGQISGQRRASMRRAQRVSLIILAVAMALFVLSLLISAAGLLFPPLLMVGGIGVLLGALVALGAAGPVFTAWQFNRK